MVSETLETIARFGAGYRSYLVAGTILMIVAIERVLGIDVPGVMLDDAWLTHILAAFGLGALRAALPRG